MSAGLSGSVGSWPLDGWQRLPASRSISPVADRGTLRTSNPAGIFNSDSGIGGVGARDFAQQLLDLEWLGDEAIHALFEVVVGFFFQYAGRHRNDGRLSLGLVR